MESVKNLRRVAFVGIGAVGGIYAQCMLQSGADAEICAIVPDAESYRQRPTIINGEPLAVRLLTPDRAEDPMDLILVCVKWYDLEAAMALMEPFMGPHTQILSLLNGIRSEEVLAARFGWERVLLALGSGIDSQRVGRMVTMRRRGVIYFGERRNHALTPRVTAIRSFFEEANVPYHVPLDMVRQLWWKLLVNVGMNQVSAVTKLNYGAFRRDPQAMALMRSAQREVIAVAGALGVDLSENDIQVWEEQLAGLSEEGCSSMLQDVRNHRKTEVEILGGEICAQGLRLGIPTPVNQALCQRISELEAEYKSQHK